MLVVVLLVVMVVVVLVVRGVEVNVGKGMRSKYGAKLICTSCGERAIDVADGGSMINVGKLTCQRKSIYIVVISPYI